MGANCGHVLSQKSVKGYVTRLGRGNRRVNGFRRVGSISIAGRIEASLSISFTVGDDRRPRRGASFQLHNGGVAPTPTSSGGRGDALMTTTIQSTHFDTHEVTAGGRITAAPPHTPGTPNAPGTRIVSDHTLKDSP